MISAFYSEGARALSLMLAHAEQAVCRTQPQAVSAEEDTAIGEPLSDDSREEAIRRAGRAMEAHYFRWCCTGNFADKGDADRARLLMERLIAGRSREQVRRMEIRKGLI